jgi:hypothetical protein
VTPTTTPTPTPTTSPGGQCTVSAILVPSCGVWWGVAPGALTNQVDPRTALDQFESEIGRNVNIVHSYHVGDQRFPTPTEVGEADQPGAPRILLINWKPEMGRTWAQVAAGDPVVDANIDAEATYIKSHFNEKFFLAIHHEPEDEVQPAAGSGMTASDYAAMYRHVALRLRADGVSNAIFVMIYMGFGKWGVQPWYNQLYPGNDVVQWIGYDPYSTASNDKQDFSDLVNQFKTAQWPGFYNYITTFAPGKPLMMSEWGVHLNSDPTRKAWFFGTVSREIAQFPAIHALVYFDTSFHPEAETLVGSSPSSVSAYSQLGKTTPFNLLTAP